MNISAISHDLTIINVFTVAPENQHRLLDLLTLATQSSVRHAEGFLSAALHRGLDGTSVTMYAQWRSAADYERMRQNPEASPYLEEALTIATFNPGLYEVSEVFGP